MKLSTKGRYGLKAIFDLAENYGHEVLSISAIAEKQKLSINYLEQLMAKLKKSGLIKSVRGAQGGYTLSRPPSEITVGQVLSSLEGSLAPTDCVTYESNSPYYCVQRMIYQKIYDGINAVVDNITLQDMLDEAHVPIIPEIITVEEL